MIQITFILFIGILLFFTLYSNTLQSLTLPKVIAEKAVLGSLEQTLEGSGILQPLKEAKLSNPTGWKVKAIAVKEGASVKKGQTLITYDSESAERELEDEIAQLAKQNIDMQNIQDQYIESVTKGDETKVQATSREIKMRKLDLGVQERKIAALRANLENNKKITAPFDGVITQINAVEGMFSTGGADILMASTHQGYRFEFLADEQLLSAIGIGVHEKFPITVRMQSGQKGESLEGTVYEIADTSPRMDTQGVGSTISINQKMVRVRVVDKKLKGGEQAEIKLTKPSEEEGFLIINAAIHQDRDGKYVYRIEEKKGAIRNEFIVRKAKIGSSESDDKVTKVVSTNFNMDDLIILESTEPLEDGNRVRLK
ncbi:efflux RND transporter periplasmic adaptor subunit [Paenibacillus lutimineralis]|uniref:Efflux RND transporter periplasmic adaptor subunit n=2 Tax=Paenibacillus lutimineralis TaxID=2707005 RepID=A0A3Q9IFV5_9BACL|nr:efflux RND transporter periplasmic adaptor subunit [Paenibacillus lutimineralis]